MSVSPNELASYIGAVATIAGGFAGAVKWLDARRERDRKEGDAKIEKLEARIAKLENEHLTGRRHIVEAISLCPKGAEYTQLSAHLVAAADALS